MSEDAADAVNVVAGVKEQDQLHWVLLGSIEVLKVELDLLDEVFQVLYPDVRPVVSIDSVDIVSENDAVSLIYLLSS